MDKPEDPDVSSTPPAVSKKKKKKKSRRGRNKNRLPEDQVMRTELETDSNIEIMCMLENRQQLPPEPPVTPTPDPEPQHSASDVSITSPGVSDGKKKKKRVSLALKQILGGQEASVDPPVTVDPAPPSEEPKIEDPQKKPEDSASADGSSTPPGAPKSSKKKSRRGRNKTRFPPMQEISSTLETDSSNKDQCMLLDLSEEPAVTPTPAPVPEHQAPATSSSAVNVVSPGDGPINTPAESTGSVLMRSSECSVEDLCRMMDEVHLSIEPWVTPTPAPVPQRHYVVSDSLTPPKPLLQPATFVFKSPPAFASAEKEKKKKKKRRSLKPEDSYIKDLCRKLKRLHLSRKYRDKPKPAPVPQLHHVVSNSSTPSTPLLQPATFVFKSPPAFAFPEKEEMRSSPDPSIEDICRMLDEVHLSTDHWITPTPAPVPQ
ncbi:uncharacterized protein LOC130570424 [Triplophysa rosa]|nr:uncharacterized protein LOC130570424 [Triplophysa rosa]